MHEQTCAAKSSAAAITTSSRVAVTKRTAVNKIRSGSSAERQGRRRDVICPFTASRGRSALVRRQRSRPPDFMRHVERDFLYPAAMHIASEIGGHAMHYCLRDGRRK